MGMGISSLVEIMKTNILHSLDRKYSLLRHTQSLPSNTASSIFTTGANLKLFRKNPEQNALAFREDVGLILA